MKNLHVALVFVLACMLHAAEAPEDFRYVYEVIGTDLDRPMTMQMAPGGKIYFNELDGKLRLLDPESKLIKTVGELEVFTQQESGFLGFALDPDFAKNGYIFIQHSLVDFEGTAISRFTIKDQRLDMASKKELLRWPVQRRECRHHPRRKSHSHPINWDEEIIAGHSIPRHIVVDSVQFTPAKSLHGSANVCLTTRKAELAQQTLLTLETVIAESQDT